MVHEIQDERVRVHFHLSFNTTGTRWNVRFQLNRTTLRRQHQALVARIPSPQRILFPFPGHDLEVSRYCEREEEALLQDYLMPRSEANMTCPNHCTYYPTSAG